MSKRYPREFRRAVCERLVAGEKVSSLSKELDFLGALPPDFENHTASSARSRLRLGSKVGLPRQAAGIENPL